ncbi:hypothetical protein L218DRAFT_1003636 [Marasmius fiardii PR-910]|nr:hypothetical protein L218DRAFT_1003636 [Marasmius fiardii PR-910]
MPHPTSSTVSNYPSHSPRDTTQALTADSVMIAQVSRSREHHHKWGKSSIDRRDNHESHSIPSRTNSTIQWNSTTTPTTTSVPSPPLLQERSHSSGVKMTVPRFPPALKRWISIRLSSQANENETNIILHPLLLCGEKTPEIYWDVSSSDEVIAKVLEEKWHPLKDLATYPALPSFVVVHPRLPWPITARIGCKFERSGGRGCSIDDLRDFNDPSRRYTEDKNELPARKADVCGFAGKQDWG